MSIVSFLDQVPFLSQAWIISIEQNLVDSKYSSIEYHFSDKIEYIHSDCFRLLTRRRSGHFWSSFSIRVSSSSLNHERFFISIVFVFLVLQFSLIFSFLQSRLNVKGDEIIPESSIKTLIIPEVSCLIASCHIADCDTLTFERSSR